MDIVDKLTQVFKEFPGIGERQARRFVYFLMSQSGEYSNNLVKLISELKKDITQCKECYRFFVDDRHVGSLCHTCSGANTDNTMLMVVEKDTDLESIEKSRVYAGKYFVLGGLVPIVEKSTPSRVRINELIKSITERKNLREVILAFSISPQGDHTDFYVRGQIQNMVDKQSIKISSLGRGLSTGTELEYSDNDTIKNALKNRQ
ncbi:MAG: recombination protein RecR [Candidatus Pacebacteria bacterium]|nr:recombination protein RecR [Candidatus Paceibacterota bacterium]MBP9851240.1 recombination protein RecR [Candidatus Paceibacterota bacterium]